MLKYKFFLFLVLVFFVSACAHHDVRPETPRQAYVSADLQFQGAVQTAIELRQQGVLDDEMYNKLNELFEKTDQGLTAVNTALAQGYEDDAMGRLQLVNNLLWDIRDILMEVRDE